MPILSRSAKRGRGPAMTLAIALVVTAGLGPAGTAFAAAGPASCMGHEASSLSPPGSSDEVPGGMPEFGSFIRANFPGPSGFSFEASLTTVERPYSRSNASTGFPG